MADLVPLHRDLEVRSTALKALLRGVLQLDDERRALADAGDYESLSAGGQDLQILTCDLSDLHRAVRLDVARIVDERQGNLSSDGSYYFGINRIEVPGVGLVEVAGGWTRTGWDSPGLLMRLLRDVAARVSATHGERIVNDDGELVDLDRSEFLAEIVRTLRDVMPLTSSLSWRVGRDENSGLKKYGIDSDDWCQKEPKQRLATFPTREA